MMRFPDFQEHVMETDRRKSPRFAFIAGGELHEEKSNTLLRTRVSEISKTGCYLDMMNPLPNGTPIQLSIAAGGELFQAKAKIVYAVEHLGAGVHFEEIDSVSEPILERWLAAAGGEQ
ncbi:MAG TPA: PilZ domain-containing protein [Candidatus Sulfotelmatobacter sp.]|jgi:hypothetical protein|nr:PilZ domain-containing protein [Candidatus Sulfotelmatobacter sp.]